MSNHCMRCNRELTDPAAMFGWRCAKKLGISRELTTFDRKIFNIFLIGVMRAQLLFGRSNIPLSDEQWKNLMNAYAKMALWEIVDEEKVKKIRKEVYSIIDGGTKKVSGFIDSLYELKDYILKNGFITGISKKTAKEGVLDNVTDIALKIHNELYQNNKYDFLGIERYQNNDIFDDIHGFVGESNYKHNKKVDISCYKNKYINDQNTGVVKNLRLGTDTMDNNGCEVIAAYNAMKALGNQQDLTKLIYHFDRDGQMLWGKFGTNPYAVRRYFEYEGYDVKTVEGEDIVNKPTPKADAYVISFWNEDDIKQALHTVAARRTRGGEYEVFNNNWKEPSSETHEDLRVYLNERGHIPLAMFCINK